VQVPEELGQELAQYEGQLVEILERGLHEIKTTETLVDTWGNSSGIRIKKSYAEQLGWQRGTQIKETIENGRLILEAVKTRPTLDELMAKVTPENLHGKFDFGPAVGNEF
jgi:antitoxin MazE